APLVPAPAACAFFAAAAHDRIPVAVGLRLVIGEDHEADGFVGFEDRAAVESDERAAEDRELDRQLLALLAAREISRGRMLRADAAVRKGRGVKLCGFTGLALIAPK